MSFDPIKLSPSGAEIYYSGAYADATGATGAGGQYASTASSQGWDTVTFKNAATRVGIGSALPTGDDISTSANYSLAPAVVIGGTTPIGDVRGEGVGYIAQGGSSTIIPLKPNEFYSGALYATYAVGSTAKLTAKVGVGTAGFSSYYQGNFTTRDNYAFDTVLNVDTGNLNATGSGSGVYTIGDTITLQTSLIDRIGDSLNTVSSINDDAFVKGINISILNEDKSIAYSNYKTDYKNPSFTFTKQENIDIFGSFTENFGVKFSVENQDGQTHETDFLLYGNRLSIEKIYVSASGGTYLDENKDNDYGPSTSDIVASDDKLEAVVGFSHRLVNTSGTTGAINFNITFDQDPNFTNYDNLLVFANTGSSTFDTTTQNLLGTFPLSQLQNQNVRIFPDDGIVEGESNFFKFVASSEVGFYNELFTVGPYSIEPVEVGTDPILYNVGEQEIVSGNLSILGQDAGGLYSLGASGSGDGQRLTGPGGLPYLLSGDAAGGGGSTGTPNLQEVTESGNITTLPMQAASLTGSNGLNQFKGSTDDANGYVLKTRNYANDDLFNVRNDGHVGIGSLAESSYLTIRSTGAIIQFGTPDGYSIKSEEKAILGVISGNVFSTGSALLGGSGHLVSGDYDVIAGGVLGTISGGDYDFIGGGYDLNVNHSEYSVVAGGKTNSIFSGDYSVIGGGLNNLITGIASDSHVDKVAIVGGEGNKVISAPYTFIGAGNSNLISGTNSLYSAILGGGYNQIKESQFATILGGDNNRISFANHSVSAGNYSRVLSGHNGAFVFSDSRTANYDSPRGNTLSLRFQSGVFVDTDSGIYINGNPVITGSSASEGDTLQTVTDRGATTTNNILSTGPHISGVTGLFSDKVGIGTNDPAYALTVNAGTTNQIARFISSDPDAVIGIQDNTDAVFLGHDAALDVMSLGFNSSMGTSSNLNIDTAGHVGIGTNNPNAELEIAASVATIRLTDSDLTNTFSEIEKGGDYLYFYSRANAANGGFLFAGDNGTTETEFMRIATDGDVGIGSNTPSAKLDVAGGIKLLDNNYLTWNSSNTRIVGNSDYLQFQVAASDKVRVTSSGVGIGTNNPRTTLHVSKAGTTEGGIVTIDNPNNSDGSYCGIEFINSTVGYPRSAIFAQRTGGYDAELTFHTSETNQITGSDYPDATERMRIDHDGNVGIGSNNPNANLDVGGSMQVKGEASWAGTDNQNGAIFMDTAGRGLLGAFSTSYARPLITANSNYIDLGSAGTSLINGLRFYAGSSSASPGTYNFYTSGSNNRLHIAKDGKVGIGTDSPDEKLHVVGDVLIDAGSTNTNTGELGFTTQYDTAFLRSSYTDPSASTETYLAFHANTAGEGNGTVAEQMRIAGNKVGIGTDDPQKNLDIQGQFMVRPTSNTTIGRVLIGSTSSDAYLELKDASSNNKVFLNTDGVSYFNGGNVGIGTDTASTIGGTARLTVQNSSVAMAWGPSVGEIVYHRRLSAGKFQIVPYYGGNIGELQLAPYGENDTPVVIGATAAAAGVKLHVEGVVSGSNSFLGTGVGNRITNNNVPYLLSGDAAAALTLQDVCDNGNTTTTSILSTGPHISGVTGFYSDRVGIGNTHPQDFNSEGNNLVVGSGAGSQGMSVFAGAAHSASLYFAKGTAGADAYRGWVQYRMGNDRLDFGAGGGRRMVIDGNGVGIGTYTVQNQLTISGNAFKLISTATDANNGQVRLGEGSNSRPILTLGPTNDYDEFQIIDGGYWKIRTRNARDLALGTNNTDAICIKGSTQQVGISTTTPSGELHVYNGASSQSFSTQGDELLVESSDHGGISILTPNAKRGHLYFNNDAFLRWVGDDDKLSINTSSSSTTIAIAESAGDTTFGGSVGIGTTNTLTRLVVDAPMFRGGTNPSGMIVTDSANGAMALELGVDRTNSASYIESRHTGSNTSYTLLLNAGYGKVGVGTVSPTSKFEVGTVAYGTDSIAKFWDGTDGVEITNRGGSRQQINFLGSNTSAINASGSLFINYDGDNNGTNDTITFARNGADENGTVDMVIKEGDVGIGTNSPISQFHITGASPVLTLNSPSSDFSRIDFVRGATSSKWDINHTAAGDLKFRENTYTKLTLYRGNGRVGIGSEIPAYTLDVAGDIQAKDSVVLAGTQAARGYSFHDLGTTWGYKALTSPGRLAVLVQGIESMTFESNGRVGIGSTDPAHYKLEVIGDISGSGSFFGTGDGGRITNNHIPYLLSGDEAGATNTLQDVCDNGNTTTTSITGAGFFIKDGSTQIGQLTKDISSSNFVIKSSVSDANLEFKGVDGGANITAMLIDMSEGGRVGIGSNTPARKLDVVGDAAVSTNLIVGTALYTNQWIASSSAAQYIKNSSAATSVAITNAGNVGIGTDSPSETLHVFGTTRLGGRGYTGGASIEYASFSETNGGASTIVGNAVYAGNSNNTYRKTRSDDGNFIALNYNKGITFHTHVTGSASSTEHDINKHEQMRLTTGGLLGIGTDDPEQPFHVAATNYKPALIQRTAGTNCYLLLEDQNTTVDVGVGATTNDLKFRAGNSDHMKLDAGGDLFLGSPTDTADKLMVQANTNYHAARFNGHTDGGQSYGVRIRAGTNSVDYGLLIENTAGADLFKVDGVGDVTGAGNFYGTGAGNRITNDGTPYLLSGDAAAALTLQDVTDNGSTTTNNMEIQGAGSKSFTVDSTDGHASVVIDRHSTSYDANLSFQTNGATKWRLWNNSNDTTFAIRDEVNASNVMTWEVGGNVGIGLEDPSTKLQTLGTISGATGLFENAKISNFNSSDYAAFGHENVADDSYAIRQHSNGNVHINCGSSRLIQFRHQNSTQGGFNASKDFFVGPSETNNTFHVDISETNVGVGTYAPLGKLTVATTMSSSPTTQLYLDVDGSNNVGGGGEVIFNTSASAGALDAYNAIVRGQRSSLNDGSSDLTFLTTHVPTSATAAARMTIKDDGKVGIGTTNPTSTLSVSGSLNIVTGGTLTRDLVTIGGGGQAGDFDLLKVEANNGDDLFRVNGLSYHVLMPDSDTKVGIGIASPQTLLDVDGAVNHGIRIGSNNALIGEGGGTTGTQLIFWNGTSAYYGRNIAPFTHTVSNHYFRVGGSDQMAITSAGVGIGTASPDTKLHVKGTAIRFEEAGGSTRHFDIIPATAGVNHKFTSDSTSAGYEFYNNANSLLNLTNTEATFNTSGENIDFRVKSSGSTAIFVDASIGTVGINQSSPSSTYALDVGGSIRMATAAPSLVLRETDSSNQEFSVFGLGGDFYVRDITQSTYPLKIEAGVANDTLVLASGGNVGIGTNAPEAQLHLFSGTAKFESADGSDNSLELMRQDNANTWNFNHAGNDLRIFNTAGAGYDILLGVNAGSSTIANKVGIGTATPARILDVSTNGSDTYGIRNSYGASHYMEMAHNRFNTVGNNYIRFNIDDSTKMTIVDSDYGGGVNGVGIGTVTPSYELDVIGTTRSTYYIGGAYFEENASSSKIKFYPNGTILVLDEDGQLKPSEKENDTLVFGVSKRDFEQPIVLGAEPILITGPIEVGDYIVTSNKQGHGQAIKEHKFGTVIAQAMEKGDGESYNIKAMIRKM